MLVLQYPEGSLAPFSAAASRAHGGSISNRHSAMYFGKTRSCATSSRFRPVKGNGQRSPGNAVPLTMQKNGVSDRLEALLPSRSSQLMFFSRGGKVS